MHKKIFCAFVLAVMLCASAWADVIISSDAFPDESFRNYISEKIDSDDNGILSDAEIASVSLINVRSRNISSLKGIEYFTSLETLECRYNHITELKLPSSVTSASISPQSVSWGIATISDDEDYPYCFDMSSIITDSESLSQIKNPLIDDPSNDIRITTGGGCSIFC